jgi:hypothetical protein
VPAECTGQAVVRSELVDGSGQPTVSPSSGLMSRKGPPRSAFAGRTGSPKGRLTVVIATIAATIDVREGSRPGRRASQRSVITPPAAYSGAYIPAM